DSDFVLRPAFLALLDRFVSTSRARGGARRIDVGEAWTFDGYKAVAVRHLPARGEPRSIPVAESAAFPGKPAAERRLRAVPPLAGLYELELDGEKTLRVASVPDREIDFRARHVLPEARAKDMGGVASSLDASPYLALGLLVLLAAELLLRLFGAGRSGDG